MRRRELILMLGGALTAAHALRAQQKTIPVIGFVGSASLFPNAAAFRQGLSETGYVEGQNVAIEYRWAEGHYDRLPALAADLVGSKVDLVVASAPPSVRAAKNATSTIPIGVPIRFSANDATSSWRWLHAMPFRRSLTGVDSPRPAV